MIASLRRRHRFFTAALLLSVPALVALALNARVPAVGYGNEEPLVESSLFEVKAPLGGLDLSARRVETDAAPRIELRSGGSPRRPDVLAYWSSAEPGGIEDLAEAYWLGPVAGRTLSVPIPGGMRETAGYLIFYSPAHQELLGSVKLPASGAQQVAAEESGQGAAEEAGR
jgi:hypothetical protein